MSDIDRHRGERLVTVERLRDMELEDSRIGHASAQDDLARQREIAQQIQSRIDETHGLARGRLQSEAGVSVDELRRTSAYASWQGRALAEQQQFVSNAQQAAELARLEVMHRFEALSVIEKLRARRAQAAALEAARMDQKMLDEHALVRAPLAAPPEPTMHDKEHSHGH
ncbi:MAG: flagellar export protein FliJ [Gammaproteobacteria bacterium]